ERQRDRRRIGIGEDESQLPAQQFRRRIDKRARAIVPDLQPPGAQRRFTNQWFECFLRQKVVRRRDLAELERIELHLRLTPHQPKRRSVLRGGKRDFVRLPRLPIGREERARLPLVDDDIGGHFAGRRTTQQTVFAL